MKMFLFGFTLLLLLSGCDTKNNEDAANNPPSLPGAGQPPIFKSN